MQGAPYCPARVVKPCPVCPHGLTVDSTTALGTGSKTCADLLVKRETTEETESLCTHMFEIAAPVCCPPAI